MNKIKLYPNTIEVVNETEENANKTKSKSHEFLFYPAMDIQKKFKISNKFDRKHSEKFLQEIDRYLEVVELDDRLPEEFDESSISKIDKINPLNLTFEV